MKIDIIICTYNRQKYLYSNLEILKTCKDYINHVFVIDNASNIPLDLSNDYVTIIHNKNLGGSGGYARGMYEAKKDKECTHIFLMDDDIQINKESIVAAYNKLKEMNPDDWLGFCMSTFEKPELIFESCSYWNGIKVHSNSRNIKIKNSSGLRIKKYNYGGWWGIIIPINFVKKHGYPLPFFIKFDDVEYALRRNNEKIIYNLINNVVTKSKKEIVGAFGGVKVDEVPRSFKEWNVDWAAPEPYAFGEEGILTMDELQKAAQDRQTMLAAEKTRTEEYRASRNSGNTAAAKPATSTVPKGSFTDF